MVTVHYCTSKISSVLQCCSLPHVEPVFFFLEFLSRAAYPRVSKIATPRIHGMHPGSQIKDSASRSSIIHTYCTLYLDLILGVLLYSVQPFVALSFRGVGDLVRCATRARAVFEPESQKNWRRSRAPPPPPGGRRRSGDPHHARAFAEQRGAGGTVPENNTYSTEQALPNRRKCGGARGRIVPVLTVVSTPSTNFAQRSISCRRLYYRNQLLVYCL